MTAILTGKFRNRNVNALLDVLKNSNSSFIAFGRENLWPTTIPNVEATQPELPADDVYSVDYNEWRQMYGAKKLTTSDVMPMVRRVDWTPNKVFTPFDDKVEQIINEANFYCLTTDYNVYLCLQCPPSGPSSVMPTSTSNSPIVSPTDGYVWKYMYTLTPNDVAKFLTTNYMPVRTAPNNVSTVGAIYHVVVTQGGSGYVSAPSVAITGDGSGATAVAQISGGQVTHIEVTAFGSGFKYPTVTITGGSGSGAAARAVLSPRDGHGYDSQRELGGSALALNIQMSRDEFSSISTANDFRKINILASPVINTPTVNAATNGTAQGGRIGSVDVEVPGTGYTPGTVMTNFYEDGQSVSGAASVAATAVVSAGQVMQVILGAGTNTGYTFAPKIAFVGGGGKGAQAIANLSGSSISSIVVTNPGAGYTSAPTVKIGGFDGTVTLTVNPSGEMALPITITNPGQNYTIPEINLTGAGPGSNASFAISLNNAYRTTYKIPLSASGGSPFPEDCIITNTAGSTARVVEFDSTNQILYVNEMTPSSTGVNFAATDTLTVSSPTGVTSTGTIASGWSITGAAYVPELVPFEGDFWYIENRLPVSRAGDQTESITIVLEA